jgi:hypothetical protein
MKLTPLAVIALAMSIAAPVQAADQTILGSTFQTKNPGTEHTTHGFSPRKVPHEFDLFRRRRLGKPRQWLLASVAPYGRHKRS